MYVIFSKYSVTVVFVVDEMVAADIVEDAVEVGIVVEISESMTVGTRDDDVLGIKCEV